MKTIEYWRSNKNWQDLIGQVGVVLSNTFIRVAPPDQEALAPYSYLLVDFSGKKVELMGVAHQEFEIGDQVKAVLRKIKKEQAADVLVYGLKAEKI
jgi:uncharacterized OB-fold protein